MLYYNADSFSDPEWQKICGFSDDQHTGTRYDYKRYTKALKAGNPYSLVAFNFKGTGSWDSNTGFGISDYQTGEENDILRLPEGRFEGEGKTQWFALCWMDDKWVHSKPGIPKTRYSNEEVVEYIKKIREKQGVFAYNTAPFQEGIISAEAMEHIYKS